MIALQIVVFFVFVCQISCYENTHPHALGHLHFLKIKITDIVFFDITIDNTAAGRIEIGLLGEIVPKTARNFKEIALRATGGYKGSKFYRIKDGLTIEGGDFQNNDGTGGSSIYGPTFKDENFDFNHNGPGMVTMANTGPDSNGSRFIIIGNATSWMNGKNVVFGYVEQGMDVVQKMLAQHTDSAGKPDHTIVISDTGTLPQTTDRYTFFPQFYMCHHADDAGEQNRLRSSVICSCIILWIVWY